MSGNCLTPYAWSCVFDSIAWWNNCSLTRISFSHIYCTPDLYPFKDPISYFIFARAFFWEMKFTPKMPISFLLILQNCQLIMIMWFQYYFHHIIIVMLTICQLILVNSPMFPYVLVSLWSVYIVTLHCDPRNSLNFLYFVTRFCDCPIYRPIYRPIYGAPA